MSGENPPSWRDFEVLSKAEATTDPVIYIDFTGIELADDDPNSFTGSEASVFPSEVQAAYPIPEDPYDEYSPMPGYDLPT